MQLGADARVGIWPHRDATSAYAIAVDREYSEIVATIEREEENRRARTQPRRRRPPAAAFDALRQAIAEGRAAEAIALMEADPALIGACDLYGVTPLHLAAWKHDPALVGWLLDHGASPGALASRSDPRCDDLPKSGKTPLDFAAIVAGWAPEGTRLAFSISWRTCTSIRRGFTRRRACCSRRGPSSRPAQPWPSATARPCCGCIAKAGSRTRSTSSAAACSPSPCG